MRNASGREKATITGARARKVGARSDTRIRPL
jgi:hypothetical protein